MKYGLIVLMISVSLQAADTKAEKAAAKAAALQAQADAAAHRAAEAGNRVPYDEAIRVASLDDALVQRIVVGVSNRKQTAKLTTEPAAYELQTRVKIAVPHGVSYLQADLVRLKDGRVLATCEYSTQENRLCAQELTERMDAEHKVMTHVEPKCSQLGCEYDEAASDLRISIGRIERNTRRR